MFEVTCATLKLICNKQTLPVQAERFLQYNTIFIAGFEHFPFLSLESAISVNRRDDGASFPIHIPGGFPFGNSVQTVAYVSSVLMKYINRMLAK